MKKRLSDVFKRAFELQNIDESISQKNCAKWDSLHHLNLVVELETEFDIIIEPEDMAQMEDFVTVERMVARKLSL